MSAVLPALTVGTSYIHGVSSGSLTANSNSVNTQDCGFTTNTAPPFDSSYVTVSSSSGSVGTSGYLYSTITVQLKDAPLGASYYEYLDGEFDLGCAGTPSSPPLSAQISIGYSSLSASGASWGTVSIEKVSGVSSATPIGFTYCGANNPSGFWPSGSDQSFGSGTCTGTNGANADVQCVGPTSPNYYLPEDGDDTTASNWLVYNWYSASTSPICTSQASWNGAFVPAASIPAGTPDWYGVVSIAFGGTTPAATVSGTWTLTVTVS
ncbi:MAG: hypothetical protein KGJ23_12320 [Euryarchaeota archaeon]|nr:hypothetical protein [Euryarchaeota archaeon]MDE2046517.1 hypothetical protein [Thermoplasmata archaeon]